MRYSIPFALLVVCAAAAAAKDRPLPPSPLLQGLRDCQKLPGETERLTCYDKSAAAMIKAADGGDLTVVDRESVNKARRSLFGFALPSLPFLTGNSSKDFATAKLETKLTSFRSLGNGFYRFGIADAGALWETTEASNLRDPNAGEKIVISRGAIGSYFAKIGNQREVRVRRLR
jgi:hypothetical protein